MCSVSITIISTSSMTTLLCRARDSPTVVRPTSDVKPGIRWESTTIVKVESLFRPTYIYILLEIDPSLILVRSGSRRKKPEMEVEEGKVKATWNHIIISAEWSCKKHPSTSMIFPCQGNKTVSGGLWSMNTTFICQLNGSKVVKKMPNTKDKFKFIDHSGPSNQHWQNFQALIKYKSTKKT